MNIALRHSTDNIDSFGYVANSVKVGEQRVACHVGEQIYSNFLKKLPDTDSF